MLVKHMDWNKKREKDKNHVAAQRGVHLDQRGFALLAHSPSIST